MPFDLELSNHELSYISKKAEQWRGEEGERRKVAVYDYVWEEEEVRTGFHLPTNLRILLHGLFPSSDLTYGPCSGSSVGSPQTKAFHWVGHRPSGQH